ncbi:core protein [Trabulsiella guamensis ATCC 49490]|uniref:Core protein n=1 Tax=Trabulsiella guamensis ATCC 49490 TaxID=1005994 RepID=A0A085AAH5_9ENTR|nr:core protein [Trabulsiella guamensis ATCC 49490]
MEQIKIQMEQEHMALRKTHLYHCDHRGLPLALIQTDGRIAWSAEYDEFYHFRKERSNMEMITLTIIS